MQNIKRYILNVVLFTALLTNLSFADSSNLPDFTKLVEANNASIVNISTVRTSKNNNSANANPQEMPNDEMKEFLKKLLNGCLIRELNLQKISLDRVVSFT